jgi:hypothetical protein
MCRVTLGYFVLLFFAVGCNPPPTVVTVPATGETKKGDIHIRTPRADVDVEKNKNGDTSVDVNRKEK